MLGFALFIFILITGAFGVGVMVTTLRALWLKQDQTLGAGRSDLLLEQVREELEAMSGRLSRLEEEVDFFQELHKPEGERRLPAGDDASEGA